MTEVKKYDIENQEVFQLIAKSIEKKFLETEKDKEIISVVVKENLDDYSAYVIYADEDKEFSR